MRIIEKSIDEIKPYKKNPRKNDKAVSAVAASIRAFGFQVPIVLDKNSVVICGHTRLKAAESLGMEYIPCVLADDLTEEQARAFRLADNKVAERATWDMGKLFEEIESLDIDMGVFGFDVPEPTEDTERDYYGAAREKTYEAYNLYDFDKKRTAGSWGIPTIAPVTHIPKRLIGFNYVLNTDAPDCGVHFYLDDYQFERIWNRPHDYMDRLRRFDCVLTPDFSLYMDMPRAMKLWNVYRSRLIGQIMQDYGLIVIPTLTWAEPETFAFCFDGLSSGGVVAVSTVGVKQKKESREIWARGMAEALKRVAPRHVVVYGGDIGFSFENTPVSFIENERLEDWRGTK